jgi:DNA-binding NarL/FixJ family response regulator
VAAPLGLRRVLGLLDSEPAPSVPAAPAGLTARETQVLRLLAEGMLNREIADRLVITENTAANHVRSILAKTGSGNRTQAAMFAATHRLLD